SSVTKFSRELLSGRGRYFASRENRSAGRTGTSTRRAKQWFPPSAPLLHSAALATCCAGPEGRCVAPIGPNRQDRFKRRKSLNERDLLVTPEKSTDARLYKGRDEFGAAAVDFRSMVYTPAAP